MDFFMAAFISLTILSYTPPFRGALKVTKCQATGIRWQAAAYYVPLFETITSGTLL